MTDLVKTPPHYTDGRDPVYEPRLVIDAWGLSYHTGSAVKYLSRAGRKGGPADHIRDLEKAREFIRFEIDRLTRLAGSKRKTTKSHTRSRRVAPSPRTRKGPK